MEFGILGSGIQNPAFGIRDPAKKGIQNPLAEAQEKAKGGEGMVSVTL